MATIISKGKKRGQYDVDRTAQPSQPPGQDKKAPSSEFADNNRKNKKHKNRDYGNCDHPICSHPESGIKG